MAAMSNADKAKAARFLGARIYVEAGATANMNGSDLFAAIGAIDGVMESLPPALGNQAQTVAQNINSALPEPFKSTATTQQKSFAVIMWCRVKHGDL